MYVLLSVAAGFAVGNLVPMCSLFSKEILHN